MRRDPTIDELARLLARRDMQVRVPRQFPVMSTHGTISYADHGAKTCSLTLAGSLVEIPTVSYIQAYSPAHLPQSGHTCWVHIPNNGDIVIMGQHISPFESFSV